MLFHIYGPVSIQVWGFMIVLGLVTATYLMRKDPYKFLTDEQLYGAISGAILSGLIGCRLLYIFTTPDLSWRESIFSFSGGAILGGIIAIVLFIVWFSHSVRKPVLKVLDMVGLYGPLVYAFRRIGCFFAGCCYGLPTSLPWGVTYTHEESVAPVCIALHPSQLYSAASLAAIFGLLYWLRPRLKQPGQLIALSIFLLSLERCVNDFFRAEHGAAFISPMQWIALSLMGISLAGFVVASRQPAKSS